MLWSSIESSFELILIVLFLNCDNNEMWDELIGYKKDKKSCSSTFFHRFSFSFQGNCSLWDGGELQKQENNALKTYFCDGLQGALQNHKY